MTVVRASYASNYSFPIIQNLMKTQALLHHSLVGSLRLFSSQMTGLLSCRSHVRIAEFGVMKMRDFM